MSTVVWTSSAVENTSAFFVGMVVFLGMSVVITPPSVSIPRDRGVTSSSNTSLTSPASTPACIAAPIPTTSSGFTPLWGSFPKKSLTTSCTLGILVEPPTKITSSMFSGFSFASSSACFIGGIVRWMRSSTSCSILARVSLMLRCFGPDWSAVMKGRLMSVSIVLDSSHLAFSAASFSR